MDKITVSGGIIQLGYRDMADQGAGWVAANSMCWQGRASQTHCVTPPTAHNWAYGMWTQPFGNGHYELSHTFVKPESFFMLNWRLVWINLQWKKRKYLCTLLMKLRSQLPSTLIGCLYSH